MLPPLPLVVEIAPGSDPSASPATWDFTSEGVRWRAKTDVTMTTGRDDEDDEVKPGSASVTLDDRTGDLSPRNVLGKWFGDLNRNTPMRIVLDTVDDPFDRTRPSGWGTEPLSELTWLHTNVSTFGVNGSAATHTNATAGTANYAFLDGNVGHDVDIYNSASISTMPTGGSWVHATVVRRDADNNHYRVYTEFADDGFVKCRITRYTGSSSNVTSLVNTGVAYSAGTTVHTHVRAIGKSIQIRVWTGSTEPDVWHASGEDEEVLGAGIGFYEWRIATNVGSLTLTVDNVRVRAALWSGQIPDFPVRWPSKSGKDAIAPIGGSGVLRWLDQTDPPVADPISQQLLAQNPQAYWTLYDGSDAKFAGSALASRYGVPASVTDVGFGSTDAPGGALSAVTLNTLGTSRVSGTVSRWAITQDNFAVMCYVRFPSLPAASPAQPLLTVAVDGTAQRWVVTCDAASLNLTAYDLDGVQVFTTGGNLYVMDPTTWWALQIEARLDPGGTTSSYSMIWHQVGSETFYAASGSFSGVTYRARQATVQAPVAGTLVSNLWVGGDSLPFVDTTFMRVSSGYAGELDTDRVSRVLTEAGIDVYVHPGTGIRLGSQPRNATALEVARDSEKAGWGQLYEMGPILAYLPYSARLNPPVAMTLDWAAGHLAEPPEPEDDDLDFINRWTSKRPSGSERTSEDPDSIARSRVYPGGDEVNVEDDDQLEDDSSWHVAIGARDLLRWPRIEIDLIAHPELISPWLGCRIGSRIALENLPDEIAGETADMILVGYEQVMRQHYWHVTLTCHPAYPWANAAVWGTTRGDSTSTVLAEALDASETSIDIVSTFREDCWLTTGGYSWNVNGEVMQVISVTAPAGTTGAFTQTATVTRHPTLAKAHPIGKPVRLAADYGVWAIRTG